MAYFADLTPYTYSKDLSSSYRNIGWLECKHPFQHGPVLQPHLQALKYLCAKPVNLTRGIHVCDLCEWGESHLDYEQIRKSERVGNGEIHVAGLKGIVYVAPVLILHYVTVHHYQPPQEFLAALRKWWRWRSFIYWLMK